MSGGQRRSRSPVLSVCATIESMVPDLFVFDFDGTLAHRPGLWSQCLLDVLDQHVPGHGVTRQDLRRHLRDGFPWHRAEVAHPELSEPDSWWAALGETIDRAYISVGIEATAAETLRHAVRAHYCDPTRFELYPDSFEALKAVRDAGARSVILSNHVPELVDIVHHLGLGPLVDDVLSSARTGFEKPHPEAFKVSLGTTSAGRALMIGDNPVADERGAEAVGMRAALVRHQDARFPDVAHAVLDALNDGRRRC